MLKVACPLDGAEVGRWYDFPFCFNCIWYSVINEKQSLDMLRGCLTLLHWNKLVGAEVVAATADV